jgi:hypothetical protein
VTPLVKGSDQSKPNSRIAFDLINPSIGIVSLRKDEGKGKL